ncbi:MAG: DUF4301 family protein [Acidobacteria bacterium]|nr:DUF4301 family protein [Acidobacteriota bacterium]
MSVLSERDFETLERRGIPREEAERQLALLASPPKPLRLLRPATKGDGVRVLPEEVHAELLELWAEAARAGRFTKLVPASGAASRMFAFLEALAAEDPDPEVLAARAATGDAKAVQGLAFLEGLRRFAFRDELAAAVDLEGTPRIAPIARATLFTPGLGLAALPKGLIKFHGSGPGAKTPFEEHLAEGAQSAAAKGGIVRAHFTVSAQHLRLFQELLSRVANALSREHGVAFDVTFSEQDPSTDTLAGDGAGGPFRTSGGDLLFRPGGHGALLSNLARLEPDIVFIKNIDNVVPAGRRAPTLLWKKLLAGLALRLEAARDRHLAALSAAPKDAALTIAADVPPEVAEAAVAAAARFVVDELGLPEPPRDAGAIYDLLDRPLRVCGVVRNVGEPGGGPFFVDGPGGASLQIVESAEADLSDPGQRAIWNSGTHFNPVDLVCAVRNARGELYDLKRFVNEDAVFLSHKTYEGRPLVALERPGLWNGAMARWITVFVEVPLETFAPVKTVLDLLRDEHQVSGNQPGKTKR